MSHFEAITHRFTHWIGTPASIIVHTIIFAVAFSLSFFGITLDDVLLILTTAVSLEAIYLAIFIQMSVNKTSQSLTQVERDIDDIQEDVEDLGENVDDIQEDVKEISEDDTDTDDTVAAIRNIELQLQVIQRELQTLKPK